MQEVSYDIEYKARKNSGEMLDATITFDLDDYMNSYSVNEFHLSQNYSAGIVNDQTYQDKKDFLKETIAAQVGGKFFMSSAGYDSLIREVDADVDSYLDEIDSYCEEENF